MSALGHFETEAVIIPVDLTQDCPGSWRVFSPLAHSNSRPSCAMLNSHRFVALRSLRLDVGRLDDRPPFLDLRLLLGGERLWGLLLARPCALADISEASAHAWVVQSFDQGSIEPGDDV